jgi:hypothetical protein
VLQAHARYNGKSSKGAAAFLTALPSVSTHLSMDDADYRESLRRWLCIDKPDPGGLCPKCDVELTAEHARRCTNKGEQNARHHAIRDLIHDTLQSCTRLVLVRKEDAGPFIDRGYTGLIMMKEKYDTYGGKHPSNYTLIPFILEQSGASCPHVHEFVKAGALHEFQLSDGAWPVSATVQRWRQKISMTLQKVLSITSRRVFSKVRAVAGRPEPEANKFEAVHLLVRPSALRWFLMKLCRFGILKCPE